MPNKKTIISVIIVSAAVCIMLPNLLTFIMSLGRLVIFIGLAIVVALVLGKAALAMNKPQQKLNTANMQADSNETSPDQSCSRNQSATTESNHHE